MWYTFLLIATQLFCQKGGYDCRPIDIININAKPFDRNIIRKYNIFKYLNSLSQSKLDKVRLISNNEILSDMPTRVRTANLTMGGLLRDWYYDF